MNDAATIRRLRDERDELLEQIRQLSAVLTDDEALPVEWRLSPTEVRIFNAMLAKVIVSRNDMFSALYWDQAGHTVGEKTINVLIYKLRRKLKPHQVEIRTVWGRGWSLDPVTRAQYRRCAR